MIANIPPKIHYNLFELISRFVSFVVCGTFVIPIFHVIDLNSYESTLKISLLKLQFYMYIYIYIRIIFHKEVILVYLANFQRLIVTRLVVE